MPNDSIKDDEGMQPYLKAIHDDWLPSVIGDFLIEIWQIYLRKVLLDF